MDYVPLLLEVLGESFADFCGVHSVKYTRFSWLLCTWSARVSSAAASSLTRIEPRAQRTTARASLLLRETPPTRTPHASRSRSVTARALRPCNVSAASLDTGKPSGARRALAR